MNYDFSFDAFLGNPAQHKKNTGQSFCMCKVCSNLNALEITGQTINSDRMLNFFFCNWRFRHWNCRVAHKTKRLLVLTTNHMIAHTKIASAKKKKSIVLENCNYFARYVCAFTVFYFRLHCNSKWIKHLNIYYEFHGTLGICYNAQFTFDFMGPS